MILLQMSDGVSRTLKLIIDNREPDTLYEGLQVAAETRKTNLVHGDVHVLGREDEVLMVIERKSWSDLLASIDDGRYRQQKKSLLETYDRAKIYYVIETGIWLNGVFTDADLNREKAIGAMIGMLVRDDIKVIFTKDIGDTVAFIKGLVRRFVKNYDKYFSGDMGDGANVDKTKKRTPGGANVFVSMLMMIPGVSEKTALAIADKYKGFRDLRAAIEGCGGMVRFRDEMLVNGRRLSQKVLDALWSVCDS